MPGQRYPPASSLRLARLSDMERDWAMRLHLSYSSVQRDSTGALASITVTAMTSHIQHRPVFPKRFSSAYFPLTYFRHAPLHRPSRSRSTSEPCQPLQRDHALATVMLSIPTYHVLSQFFPTCQLGHHNITVSHCFSTYPKGNLNPPCITVSAMHAR